jgi:type I restriction enzyme S subunit
MNKQWQMVKLGDIMTPVARGEAVNPAKEYRLLGVRLDGQGPFLRETVMGSQTSANKFFRVAKGDFIYSRLFACRGAFGVIGDEVDDCYVSSEFPTFVPVPGEVDVEFLNYWFRLPSVIASVDENCSGSTPLTRNRFKENFFLALNIPLPPLVEQRRIVARIKILAAKIQEGHALRDQAIKEVSVLATSTISDACAGKWSAKINSNETARQLIDRVSKVKWPGQVTARNRKHIALPPHPEVPDSWVVVEAGELQERGVILDIQDGNHGSDYPRKTEFGNEGVPFVTAKQFDNGTVDISNAPRLPHDRASKLRIGFAKANDVLLTHNASVGDVAIAPTDSGAFLLGTSATYWRCNPQALEPRYLFYFMQSEHFQGQLRFIMKQTTRNQVSILKQVSLWICLPPISEQRRLVAKLDAFQAEVDTLEQMQAETAIELAALLPSVLSKAFAGEL